MTTTEKDIARTEAARLLGRLSAKAATAKQRKDRATKGGLAAQAKLTKAERSRRAKLRWQRWRENKAKAEPFRDGVPCDHPGCLNHVSHPCEGCGRIAGRQPRAARARWAREKGER